MSRHHTFLVLPFALGLAGAIGCYTGASLEPGNGNSAIPVPTQTVQGTEPSTSDVTGVPCEVATVIAKSCASCHGDPPTGGAPNPMLTYEHLMSPSKTDPSKTYAQLSVERMKETKKPMPPSGPAPLADVAAFESWLAAGAPKGTCTTAIEGGGSKQYDTPEQCSSGTYWTRGDHESPLMHPGRACIDCHESEREAPLLTVAGTVYPTAHEPDDCNGANSGTVVITGADGKTLNLQVNGAGNFYSRTARVAAPYRAKVVVNGKTREMITPQTNTDCNGCHTLNGNEKAPGRIMAPAP